MQAEAARARRQYHSTIANSERILLSWHGMLNPVSRALVGRFCR